MASYPAALPALSTARADATVTATTHAADHNSANDEVNAVCAVLGTSPQGGLYDTVKDRMRGMGQFLAPQSGILLVNQYIDQSIGANVPGTLAATVNTLRLTPFFVPVRFSIDQLGINVSTLLAGNVKYGIWDADPVGGAPGARLYSSADISTGVAGHRAATGAPVFQFEAGLYWLGCVFSAGVTCRTIPLASCRALGPTGADTTAYAVQLVKAHTYANALPNPYTLAAGDFSVILPYTMRMRVASIG